MAAEARKSGQSDEVFADPLPHLLVEPAYGVTLEVRRLLMGFKRLLARVLLIDDDGVGIAVNRVRNVCGAAGFLARGESQGTKNLRDFGAVLRGKSHANGEADHG